MGVLLGTAGVGAWYAARIGDALRADAPVDGDEWVSLTPGRLTELPASAADIVRSAYTDALMSILAVLEPVASAAAYAHTGRVLYLTATNIAFYRDGFPGYDAGLTQGGDEVDLLRRLRRWRPIVWDEGNVVTTSSRRLDQGLVYTLLVSFGYYYALGGVLNQVVARSVVAPPVRPNHGVRRRNRWWRR